MDVREAPDGSLVITHDSSRLTKWLIAATVVVLGVAAYDYFQGSRGDERLIGLPVGATTLGLPALVILEQARFRIDPASRLVEWEQRWGFRRRGGDTRFSDSKHVGVEMPIGDSVKLLVETDALSLTDAKRRVDEVARR